MNNLIIFVTYESYMDRNDIFEF